MNDAGPGFHPLHVSRAQEPVVARGILMLHFSLEHIGDGIKATMWVVGSSHSFSRRVLAGTHFIGQQERVDHLKARTFSFTVGP